MGLGGRVVTMLGLTNAGRILFCAAMTAALLGLPAPAQATPIPFTRLSAHDAIRRDGREYRVSVRVTRISTEDQEVRFSLRRRIDPDGDGPLRSSQAQHWYFNSVDNAMTKVGAHLGTATLDLGDPSMIRPFGRASALFEATSGLRTSCDGHHEIRAGTLSGRIVLHTQTARFGTIELDRMAASLFRRDRDCPADEGNLPCRGLFGVSGSRYRRGGMYLFAELRPGRATGLLGSENGRDLETGRAATQGYVSRIAGVRVPADHITIHDDLRYASFHGAHGTYIRGRAVFRSPEGTETTSVKVSCGRDSGGTDLRRTYRSGTISGSVRVQWVTGTFDDLADGDLSGAAYRDRVLPTGQ